MIAYLVYFLTPESEFWEVKHEIVEARNGSHAKRIVRKRNRNEYGEIKVTWVGEVMSAAETVKGASE